MNYFRRFSVILGARLHYTIIVYSCNQHSLWDMDFFTIIMAVRLPLANMVQTLTVNP